MIVAGRGREIGPLLNENFDLRRRICKLGQGNIDMVEAARIVGASAKFTGSGGAIVGTYEDEAMFEKLKAVLEPMQVAVIHPKVMPEARTAIEAGITSGAAYPPPPSRRTRTALIGQTSRRSGHRASSRPCAAL